MHIATTLKWLGVTGVLLAGVMLCLTYTAGPAKAAPGFGNALEPTAQGNPAGLYGRGYINGSPGGTLRVCVQYFTGGAWGPGTRCADHASPAVGSIKNSLRINNCPAAGTLTRSIVSYKGVVANPSSSVGCFNN